MTKEELAKIKCRIVVDSSHLNYLLAKDKRTKKENVYIVNLARKISIDIKRLKKARKEALKNENK